MGGVVCPSTNSIGEVGVRLSKSISVKSPLSNLIYHFIPTISLVTSKLFLYT